MAVIVDCYHARVMPHVKGAHQLSRSPSLRVPPFAGCGGLATRVANPLQHAANNLASRQSISGSTLNDDGDGAAVTKQTPTPTNSATNTRNLSNRARFFVKLRARLLAANAAIINLSSASPFGEDISAARADLWKF